MEDHEINLDAPMTILQETTVATINGQRLGCGNVLVRPFVTAEGEQMEGLSVTLSFAESGERITVGEGSVFAVGDTNWRVLLVRAKSEEQHFGEAVIEQVLF